jgi:hypothetical protein
LEVIFNALERESKLRYRIMVVAFEGEKFEVLVMGNLYIHNFED